MQQTIDQKIEELVKRKTFYIDHPKWFFDGLCERMIEIIEGRIKALEKEKSK